METIIIKLLREILDRVDALVGKALRLYEMAEADSNKESLIYVMELLVELTRGLDNERFYYDWSRSARDQAITGIRTYENILEMLHSYKQIYLDSVNGKHHNLVSQPLNFHADMYKLFGMDIKDIKYMNDIKWGDGNID